MAVFTARRNDWVLNFVAFKTSSILNLEWNLWNTPLLPNVSSKLPKKSYLNERIVHSRYTNRPVAAMQKGTLRVVLHTTN